MALKPAEHAMRHAHLRLDPFDPVHADLVASWVRNARETLWLAPRTTPPLTGEDIRQWHLPGHEPLQLTGPNLSTPLAYGELNILNGDCAHFWLGHLIVPPDRRRCGLGRVLTTRLLSRAFDVHGAEKVSLVVFPHNQAAIACYRAAGMWADGYEQHYLPIYGRHVRLLRMVAVRAC